MARFYFHIRMQEDSLQTMTGSIRSGDGVAEAVLDRPQDGFGTHAKGLSASWTVARPLASSYVP